MKILFSSYAFSPSVGGIESVSAVLAEEFTRAGNAVDLVTETPGAGNGDASYRVIRRPAWRTLRGLLRECDVVFQNNISLRHLIPALLVRKPTLVVHQTWIQSESGRIKWNDRLKRRLLPRVTNIAISQAVASRLSVPCRVIGNPYRDDLFRLMPVIAREKTLVFLGRLVSDKGVDLLLHAMKILQPEGFTPSLTIVGTGPEEEKLRQLSRDLELDSQVTFAGQQSGNALAELLNQHRIMVVPSRWAEPFGVVALEGIACGCVVLGSENGGLREAIGPCGLTFENGNAPALADGLRQLLRESTLQESMRQRAPSHLANFTARKIAAQYLEILEGMAR
jgi:glycogen(starch) synthase